MLTYLWIAIGSAIGGVARYAAAAWVAALLPPQPFPWGTVLVNITGSFLIGLFAGMSGPGGRVSLSADWRAFTMVGICGGYTTFSSFSLQTVTLMQDGHWGQAGANVGLSVAVCLGATYAGQTLGTALNHYWR